MSAAAKAEPEIDTEELIRRVMGHFRSPRYQPPLLPVVAVEIMAISQDPDASAKDIVAVVERDPLLAAKVLTLAQTAAYSGGRLPTKSLADAVSRLGTGALRDMVFEISLNTRIFQAPGYTEAMERLRVHSVATARITQVVCRHTGIREDFAFLAGLLHDVGIAGLFIALAEMPDRPEPAQAWAAVQKVHAGASGQLCSLWRLPRELVDACRHHHDVIVDGKPSPLNAILIVAERLAFQFAPLVGDDPSTGQIPKHMPGKDLSGAETVKAACGLLRINGRTWSAIAEEAKKIAQEVR